MRGVLPVFIHSHGLKGGVHPLADLRRRDPQIFGGKGHVLFHHIGYNLVVRVLEHHAYGAADVQQPGLVGGVHAAHPHLAPGGEQDGVHMLGQGGLAGAVVAQHGHEGARFDLQIHSVQHDGSQPLGDGIGEAQVVGFDDGAHVRCLVSGRSCGP